MRGNKGQRYRLFFLLALGVMGTAYGLEDRSYAIGRYWGEKPIEKLEKEPAPSPSLPEKTPHSSKLVLSNLTEAIEEAKAKAILSPTVENVKNFMVLKNKTTDMASRFSHTWQEVLLAYPSLDYATVSPTHNQGILVRNKQRQEKKTQVLKTAAKHRGLLYFYRGEDPIAQLQAPIITRLANKYHFDFLGVSMDGKVLSTIEKNTVDNGQAHKMGIQSVPALFAFEPVTGVFFPLSYTLQAEQDLEERLFEIFRYHEKVK